MASVVPTERKRTVRSTSRMMPSRVSPRDYALVERFVFDNGRDPKSPGDGPAYWAMMRGRAANLAAQATTPKQEWEPDSTYAWRRRTAIRELMRTAKRSRAARRIVRQIVSARPREAGSSRARGTATSRGGDSGDRPPPPDLNPVDDRALRRGGTR
jgi:hypothetical protein